MYSRNASLVATMFSLIAGLNSEPAAAQKDQVLAEFLRNMQMLDGDFLAQQCAFLAFAEKHDVQKRRWIISGDKMIGVDPKNVPPGPVPECTPTARGMRQ